MSIPVVDVTAIVGQDSPKEAFREVASKLASALSVCGFVYIRGHGINPKYIDEVFDVCKNFFDLDETQKNEFKLDQSLQGYLYNGQEHLDILKTTNEPVALNELRESFSVTDVSKDNKAFPPNMADAFNQLGNQLVLLVHNILKCLSMGMNEDSEWLSSKHTSLLTGDDWNTSALRALHYPALTSSSISERSTRCGEHCDYGTITLLMQDSVGGLQVRTNEDEWIDALHLEDSILINLGEVLEKWSHNRWKATRHRVVIPKGQARLRSRYSLVFFVHPDRHVEVDSNIDFQTHLAQRLRASIHT